GRDAGLAARVLESAGIAAETCRDLADLRMEIQAGAGAVVLTEEALTPAALNDLSEIFASQLPWSDLPVLVFCGSEARSETIAFPVRRLATLANVTFLDRPTRKVALVSAVRAALRARTRQYEVRNLLLELEHGVRERDQFLAMLGHELRNPLGAILTSVQLMEQRDKDALAAERAVIQRQTALLTRLVDDLLDVSRVTSGKIALERVDVNVREVVERCVEAHSATAAARKIDVAVSNDGRLFLVEGDPVRLEQIVNNLLTNAFKYTPPGGHVFVTISSDGSQGEIRIRDTGVGIDAHVLPRIFDLFTQEPGNLDRAQGGLGIGLTLVRSLVQLHRGTVRAESGGRNQGSTFIVRLPLTVPRTAKITSRPQTPPQLDARRILLIEDNADVREGLARLLQEVGHDVRIAEDGVNGFLQAIQHRPEVALVDIGLPRLDGYEVARRIRGALGSRILLVALTGYGLPEDRRRALEAGFDAHLTKPITLNAILTFLAHNPPKDNGEREPDQTRERSGGDSVA
ncbi:MAG TPA: ATP-binding protein, partial [Thermoanaerobaculia bacterium]